MKKFKNIFALLVLALVGLTLTGCSEDNLDTNQYKGGVTLNVWGPNPVLRNGQSYLRFLGSNLDQVTQVIIPGVGPITNIEVVKSGVPSEIRVLVPKDGPIEGYVTLITANDQEIVTQTKLTYTENIVFEKFSPESAMPGEIITIEGDYMNLIHMVEFADGVRVSEEDFVSQDRYKIEVVLPEEARTGRINLYTADLTVETEADDDVSYNIITSDEILEVGLPTVTKIAGREEAEPLGNIVSKVGETVTITGTNLELIDAIKFGTGDDTFTFEDFTVSEDGKTISFELPAEAPDGDINLICRSGVEVPAGTLETVAPSNCTASPNPVKNGAELTISGQDMDVVASVEFLDKDGNTIDGGEIEATATKVVVAAVPELAVEGTLVLRMANGKGVEVPFTLVKPAVTAYNPNPANAGGALVIEGTDLDLVASIAFGAGVYTLKEGDAAADGTSINLTVPMEGQSGKPVFTLKNGMTVEAPEITIEEAKFCYITEMPNFDEEENIPDAGDLFTVPVANYDVLTEVQVNGTSVEYAYSSKNKTLTISIPENAKAASTLKLISSNGEIEYDITVKPNTEITTVLWTGGFWVEWNGQSPDIGNADGGGMSALSWGGSPDWSQYAEGTDLVITLAKVGTVDGQLRVANGSWGALTGTENPYAINEGDTKLTVTLTSAMLNDLITQGGLVLCGQGVKIFKVAVVEHISLETDLKGLVTCNNGSEIAYPFTFTWDAAGQIILSGDILSSLGLKKGSKLIVYKQVDGKGQVQINYSSAGWPNITTIADWNQTEESLEYEFTSETVARALSEGLAIQGDLYGVTKIAILP